MPIRLLVAVTDRGWFDRLRRRPDLAEVNFWAPSDVAFRALGPGELFLFKLRAPVDRIVGGGVFAYATTLPCSLAWRPSARRTAPPRSRPCGRGSRASGAIGPAAARTSRSGAAS